MAEGAVPAMVQAVAWRAVTAAARPAATVIVPLVEVVVRLVVTALAMAATAKGKGGRPQSVWAVAMVAEVAEMAWRASPE